MLKFGSKHDSNIVYKCTVRLLEDTEILECEYRPHDKGNQLLEHVCQQLNIIEQDYFGLRYVDNNGQRIPIFNSAQHWLDLGKSILKQVKDLDPVLFSFRIKFYPPDPFRLKEEITRYQIFLQMKRDLLHGRLYCGSSEAAMLMALLLQGELGDYDPEIHVGHYGGDLKVLLKQTQTIEEKAMDIHQKQLKGQDQSQVETSFLKLTCQLDTYGVDPHPVKDHKGTQLYLGINYSGILTFQRSRKTHHFKWLDIHKINYEGKMFIIHLNYNEKKHTVGFKCPTGAACRHIWRCAMEQMLFFTLPTSSDAPSVVSGGGFFSWGTKFKYTGRTEREILEDHGSHSRRDSTVQNASNMKRKASSVPATPSTPLQPHLGYSTLPRSSHSDVGGSRMETSSSIGLLSGLDSNPVQGYSDLAALETVCEDQESISARKIRTTDYCVLKYKDDSIDRFSDYYFRDSFEHSSSESQLIDNNFRYETTNLSHRSSRSQTPLPPSQVDGRLHNNTPNQIQNKSSKDRKMKRIGAFLPAFMAVIVFAIITIVFVFESDNSVCEGIRNIPEISMVRHHVYEPIKTFFRNTIS